MDGDLMAEMVKVPGVGEVKRQHVMIAAALVAGIVGYAWWRQGTAGPSDFPAYTDEDVTDAITDTPGGAPGPVANSGGDEWDNSTSPDTDPEWVMAATDYLSGIYEPDAVSGALGRYVTGQTLNALQEEIVRAAIGSFGYPPGGAYPIKTGGGSTPSALTEPKGVRAISSTASTIVVTWDAVPGADGYRAYLSGAGAPENVAHSVDNKVTVGGLRAATEYTIHIRAMDSAGKTGPASAKIKAKTSGAALKAPTGLKARKEGATVVYLTWKPVPGAEGYRVYHDGSKENVGASRDAAARISSLQRRRTYKFHVRAVAGNTTGPASSRVTVKTN